MRRTDRHTADMLSAESCPEANELSVLRAPVVMFCHCVAHLLAALPRHALCASTQTAGHCSLIRTVRVKPSTPRLVETLQRLGTSAETSVIYRCRRILKFSVFITLASTFSIIVCILLLHQLVEHCKLHGIGCTYKRR